MQKKESHMVLDDIKEEYLQSSLKCHFRVGKHFMSYPLFFIFYILLTTEVQYKVGNNFKIVHLIGK